MRNTGVKYKECIYKGHDKIAKDLAGIYEPFIKSVVNEWKGGSSIDRFDEWVVNEENKSKFIEIIEDTMNLKNSSFESEQEIRGIIAVDRTEIKTRFSEQLITPYIAPCLWGEHAPLFNEKEVTIGQVIHQVWLGPKCNGLNKTAINMLGIEKNYVDTYNCGYV